MCIAYLHKNRSNNICIFNHVIDVSWTLYPNTFPVIGILELSVYLRFLLPLPKELF